MQHNLQCHVIGNPDQPMLILPSGCMIEGCPVPLPPHPITLRVLTELHPLAGDVLFELDGWAWA